LADSVARAAGPCLHTADFPSENCTIADGLALLSVIGCIAGERFHRKGAKGAEEKQKGQKVFRQCIM
jgi:hypothetical protein